MNLVKGWILDVYPAGKEMVTWIKDRRGGAVRLVEEFHPDIYVQGAEGDLRTLSKVLIVSKSVEEFDQTRRLARLRDSRRSDVLRIEIGDPARRPFLAKKILRLGDFRRYELFNVDIPLAQLYLYGKDLFPLAYVEAKQAGREVQFKLVDSLTDENYRIPTLTSMWLQVEISKRGAFPSFEDPLKGLVVSDDEERAELDRGNERDKLLELSNLIADRDPDLLLTRHGDSFYLPYLAWRARRAGILGRFFLGREEAPLRVYRRRTGRSYFSYGKIYYKPPPYYLLGRVHLDVANSFIYEHCGMDGLVELARLTRVPLQRLSRATIGTGLTSMQMYQAIKDGVLIPWRKRDPEAFKSAWSLLQADRGGFVFEPRVGIHENVGELDFVSMYPYIMAHHNISPDTVLCDCCPNSEHRVPDIGYNICEKRLGLVPKVIGPLIERRIRYKKLRDSAKSRRKEEMYRRRQDAIKWILVCCFGYLGYRNARFGRIEAHEAVCAFGRDKLLRAASIAEGHGYKLVHGIVDALWLKRDGASDSDFAGLGREIGERLEAPVDYEGRYRWIVFLPSKIRPGVGVLNRYYGIFMDGVIKVRGIEARRRDAPPLIGRAQLEMIEALSGARNSKDFIGLIPEALNVAKKYAERIRRDEADPRELVICKQISRRPVEYSQDVHQAIAAKQQKLAGLEPRPGEIVRYIVINSTARRPWNRVRAVELYDAGLGYDRYAYLRLLVMATESLLSPFGYTYKVLFDYLIHGVTPITLRAN